MQASFWVAASGIANHQRALDVTANNVANADTLAYKTSQIQFQDVFAQTIKLGGAPNLQAGTTVNPYQRGQGVELSAITKNFTDGTAEPTNQQTDLALRGPGFFVLRPPTGSAIDTYYTRAGNFQIDGQASGAAGAGPIRIVSGEGYTLQGVVATIDPLTGRYTLPGGDPASVVDVEFDPTAPLGPFATTTLDFGLNLDAASQLAIDPAVMAIEKLGVDRSVRIAFQRASADGDYFFFTVQDPDQDPVTLQYATEVDGITGAAITGVIQVDATGNVVGVFENSDADAWLTAGETAGLVPWANVDGLGNPIFTIGTAPAAAVAGEAVATLTVPAAFDLDRVPNAGTLNLTLNGVALVENEDYTLAGTTVTPTTAWYNGVVTANYTSGVTNVSGETHDITNVTPNQSFRVVNFPIQAGTLIVNATRDGVPVSVANGDYSVNEETGVVTPLRLWDAGAFTVDYTPADTRVTVTHNIAGSSIGFAVNNDPDAEAGSVTREIRTDEEVKAGAASSIIDDADNEHSLAFQFERISANRWSWTATPTYRTEQDATFVVDSAAGGGTTLDGTTVLPNTLVDLGNGRFDIKILVDEGNGFVEFQQVAAGGGFPSTSASSRYFQVVDPVTGAIAFSRDLNTTSTDFAIFTEYKSNVTTGEGIIAFTEAGYYDAANSVVHTPINVAPQGATALAITPDFTELQQFARKSDATVTESDGFREGILVRWNFDESGRVVADFSNGLQEFLAQVAVARFNNPEGLLGRGENIFFQSASSGTATLHLAGPTSTIGALIVPRALETSNVELSEEMANLILFQRSYQFNSRIITTTDELIQESIRMKR